VQAGKLPQPIPLNNKANTFGLGPDVTLAIAKANTVYGFVTVRYFWEVYAKSTTKGNGLYIAASFPFHPIKVPGA
jgi:hypothetical protein